MADPSGVLAHPNMGSAPQSTTALTQPVVPTPPGMFAAQLRGTAQTIRGHTQPGWWPLQLPTGEAQLARGPPAQNRWPAVQPRVGAPPPPSGLQQMPAGIGEHSTSSTSQQKGQRNSGGAWLSSSAAPPGRHAQPPLQIEPLHGGAGMQPGASTMEQNLGYPTPTVADPPIPRDPPKSTTKGRAKMKRIQRIQSALELHPKRKNKCSYCGSVDHNSAYAKQDWCECKKGVEMVLTKRKPKRKRLRRPNNTI